MQRHDKIAMHFAAALELKGELLDDYLSLLRNEDSDLCDSVNELIENSAVSAQLFKTPNNPGHLVAATQALSQPESIGPYRIIRELGEGGMALVYLAEQSNPQRQVAIKIIKSGADSTQIMERFALERDALALMDHPGIAHIFDAGTTEQGKPYFVMEYVDGLSITRFADEQQLSVDARVKLIIKVCEAVQHAHQRGLIHRDLKPSNILVKTVGTQIQPIIIDFGVARSISITGDSELTQVGQVIGTPAYMSLEQATADFRDIDTRTDVYAIGVVLYELLTGLPTSPDGQLLRLQPLRMKTAIKRLDRKRCKELAIGRSTTRSLLKSQLRGDLEWIAQRAIATNRTDRYHGAADFAADLQRYIHGEAVLAHPPSAFYQVRRLLKRHPIASAFSFLGLTSLVAGSLAMYVLYDRAKTSEQLALTAQHEANQSAQSAQREALRSSAVTDFMIDLFEFAQPGNREIDGDVPSARQLLDYGVNQIEEQLQQEPAVRASMLESMARVYLHLGHYEEAEPLATQALDILSQQSDKEGTPLTKNQNTTHRQALRTRGLVHFYQGEFAQAENYYEQALAPYRQDGETATLNTAEYLHNLANAVFEQGHAEQAQTLFNESLTIRQKLGADAEKLAESHNSLASVHRRLGDFDSARTGFEQALRIRREIGQLKHPDTAIVLSNLGVTHFNLQQYDDAEQLLREALSMQRDVFNEEHPQIGTVLANLGATLVAAGKLGEAEAYLIESTEWHQRLLGDQHPGTANALLNLGSLYYRTNRYEKSASNFTLAIEVFTALPSPPPTLGIARCNLANSLLHLQQPRKALEEAEQGLKQLESTLPADHPWIAVAKVSVGSAALELGDQARARKLLEAGVPVLERVFGAYGARTIEAKYYLNRAKSN